MAVNVSLPLIAPSGLQATVQSGGEIDPGTYYYVVIAYEASDVTPDASYAAQLCYHSPISAEDSFVITSGNQSVLIQWTNVTGATRYNLLISDTSGDYTNSGMYGDTTETVGSITDGATGYTVTALSTSTYIHHSCQLVNNLTSNLDKDLGILKVELTGNDGSPPTYYLKDLYNAIVASGYQDYVYYDGHIFTLKGTIETAGTESGILYDQEKVITIVRGCIRFYNPNFIFRLGQWISDEAGAQYLYGSTLTMQNCRYPLCGVTEVFEFYGCLITHAIRPTDLTENLNNLYYTGGSQQYLSDYIENVRDCIIAPAGRAMAYADIKDLKWQEGNNWGARRKIRIKTHSQTSCHGWNNFSEGNFYNTTFTQTSYFTACYYGYDAQWSIGLYDCLFPNLDDDNLVPLDKIRYNDNGGGTYLFGSQGEFFFYFYNSLKLRVIDEEGNALSGVNVNATTASGEQGLWIEHDGTFDRLTNGTTYTTDRTTDSNGELDYYLESYKMNHDPNDSSGPPSYVSQRITKYPYTITLSKQGYKPYAIKLNLWKPEDMVVTLKSAYDRVVSYRIKGRDTS